MRKTSRKQESRRAKIDLMKVNVERLRQMKIDLENIIKTSDRFVAEGGGREASFMPWLNAREWEKISKKTSRKLPKVAIELKVMEMDLKVLIHLDNGFS